MHFYNIYYYFIKEYNPQFAATTSRILEILKEHFVTQIPSASYECELDKQTVCYYVFHFSSNLCYRKRWF